MDSIIIKDLSLYAYHGVNPEEKEMGQRFELDLRVMLDLSLPCVTDRVEDTVSYAKIIKAVRTHFTSRSYDLLERAAETTVEMLFETFAPIQRVTLLLKKPDAPIAADFAYVGVEITRDRPEKK